MTFHEKHGAYDIEKPRMFEGRKAYKAAWDRQHVATLRQIRAEERDPSSVVSTMKKRRGRKRRARRLAA